MQSSLLQCRGGILLQHSLHGVHRQPPRCSVRAHASDSAGFKSNLRKGFQPAAKKLSKPPPQTQDLQLDKKAVLGSDDNSEQAWREVDKKLNKYPGLRTFTAIGTGGEDFKNSMIKAVESVLGEVQRDRVRERPSSNGQYVSVKIGPVVVLNPDQVIQVFACIKTDKRLKWMM